MHDQLRRHLVLSSKAAAAAAFAWILVLPMGGARVAAEPRGDRGRSGVAAAGLPTELPTVVDLALVVGWGTAVSHWGRGFGTKAAWGAYLGLTGIGATVGVVFNLLLPPLALTPMAGSVTRLRELLAAQLDDLADGLLGDGPPSAGGVPHRGPQGPAAHRLVRGLRR